MKQKVKIFGSVSIISFAVFLPKILDQVDSLVSTIQGWLTGAEYHWQQPQSLRYAVVVLLTAAVFSAVFAFYYRRKFHRLNDQVFVAKLRQKQLVLFVPPTLEGFYGEYLSALVTAARLHAGTEREITILPHFTGEADFCPEQRLGDIVRQYSEHDTVKGVFVIPQDPSRNKEALTKRPTDEVPIVTLDVYPDAAEDPSYPHFVGGDEAMGGRCAAFAAIELFESKLTQSNEFQILILIGSTTPWESQRVDCFMEELKDWAISKDATLNFVKSKPLNYQYNESVDYLENWPARRSDEGVALMNPLDADLIFACSDTMALGAAKAVRHLMRQPPERESSRVRIIGYDGTVGMKRALEAGSDVLLATVDVQLDVQARRAVEVMMKLMRNEQCERRMTLVSPRVLRP